jgi:hypothetical protein
MKMMSKTQKTKIREPYDASKYPEMSFLDMVAHEVENFKPGFSSKFKKIRKTFILSTTLSASFGIEISEERAFIGIPKIFFDSIYSSRIDSICTINGQAGIFIILTMGPMQEVVAIRIFCTKKRAELVSNCEKAVIMAIDDQGEALPASERNIFELGIISKNKIEWE